MISIPLNNNAILHLSKSENNNDEILFKIEDSQKRLFEEQFYFEFIQDLFEENITIEQFFKYLKNNPPLIIEKRKEKEVILKIKAKSSLDITLKEIKGINNETPKNSNNCEIKEKSKLLKNLNLEIGNNEKLFVCNSNMKKNFINIIYINKNINKIYKTSYETDEIEDLYKYLQENNIKTEKGDNDNEIKLKINYENKILIIILKEKILINDDKIKKIKEKYYEKIKKAKEMNEKLYNKNKELNEKIEREKIKNDEIIRIYLENRLKYEEILKKYNDCKKLSLNI